MGCLAQLAARRRGPRMGADDGGRGGGDRDARRGRRLRSVGDGAGHPDPKNKKRRGLGRPPKGSKAE
jgi:hypothetical protein